MYQEIAVAKGAEYDRLNQKMDGCQENIETLSDEIQRLQGSEYVTYQSSLLEFAASGFTIEFFSRS